MAAPLHLQLLLAMFVPAIAQLEMRFTKYPESVIAPLGDRVTFECEVNVPGERFVWRWKSDRDGDSWAEVQEGDGRKIIPGLPGRSTKMEIEVTMNMETTWYQCVVWYGAISLTSVPARLTVARLITAPGQMAAEERVIIAPLQNTVIIHCKEPTSEPPAVLTWWKEGSKGKRKQLETPHGVLVIHNATAEDSGTYSCRATNELSGDALEVAQKTHLKVQREDRREVRFLESDDYVGVIDEEGVLTMPVKPNGVLRLWCGAVSTPPPKISWSLEREGELKAYANEHMLMVSPFTPDDEGIYSCSANGIRRSWKVIALQPPRWDGNVTVSTPKEGGKAHVTCGNSYGEPPPHVYWVLNAEMLKNEKGVKANNTDLYIEHVEKRHAGIVQCFACNPLGCAYGAGMLTVVPLQIPDQDYPVEIPKTRYSIQPPKRHSRKNPRKHKAVMIPPSRPNVTRLNDESVMVSWSHDNQGLTIRFFKVQYREVSNSSNVQWNTANQDIPAYIHSYQIDGLTPGKYYKFRIAAVYSNQDNKQGKSSARFHLQRGGFKAPRAPVLSRAVPMSPTTIQLEWTVSIAAVYSNQDNKQGKSSARFHLQRGGFKAPRAPVLSRAVPMSPTTIQLEWTWTSGGEVEAEGFYVYYRAVSSAGAYEKVTTSGKPRELLLTHLSPDTSYDIKLQAYTAQAASEFSAIKTAKTLRSAAGPGNTSAAPLPAPPATRSAPGALVTAGGALGATALLVVLATALLLCRRARRPTTDIYTAPPATRSAPGALVTAGGALGATALLVVLATALLLCRRARRPTTDIYTAPPATRSAPGALVTAGGALGATALLVVLATALLLCRRARRPTTDIYTAPPATRSAPGALVTAGGALGATALLVVLATALLLCRRARRPTTDIYTAPPATRSAPGALVTAGGALGATALLVVLATALLLCRRARRPTTDKEKGSAPESGGANGYIPANAKVPITITANPMHSEGGDAGVEMSFLHNNNTGNNDDTLPHSRKNGPAPRQYV
ncbi:hypothetical protein PYW07_012395 [Mythimna separata]|uniref:Interference hedgehog n=1 Tax=Mythimna separata TaxID=271217 RepID=A0AAD7YL37_MYTSE|nr:hypothetical protein PYW07_012395 [Mythimna separata]